MKRQIPFLALLTLATSCRSTSNPPDVFVDSDVPEFSRLFTGSTLRFDFHHAGGEGQEHVAPEGFRREGAWPGSRTQLVDATNLGKYRFVVSDRASKRILWSRGYSSIYGEWETTNEAKTTWRTFEESQRFPEPKEAVDLALEKRGDDGEFRAFWHGGVEPGSRFVDRSEITPRGAVVPLFVNGPCSTKVDLLIVAEGYTRDERAKFERDARRMVDVMFATEPYRSHRSDFNVRILHVPSAESGISNPRKDVWRDSPLGCSFNAFDSDRYVLTLHDRELREIAAQAPYDALILLANERKYGGGGIFGLWATVTADTEPAPYVFVHEFGHAFAGLADEYYTSQVAYENFNKSGVEPWEPNATVQTDRAHLKWADLVEASTPLPTPWRQAEYDAMDLAYQKKRQSMIAARASEEASEALMREIKAQSTPFLAAERYAGKVGAFEGSMYEAKGFFRPEADCIMFTRNPRSFCRVCARAIERTIALYTR